MQQKGGMKAHVWQMALFYVYIAHMYIYIFLR